jgi:hypothetical protein
MDEAMQQLRGFFGWSRSSDEPLRYARTVFFSTFAEKYSFSSLPLPSEVEYYDDFSDTQLSVPTPEESDIWTLIYDARSASLSFSSWQSPVVRKALHHLFVHTLRKRAPQTTANTLSLYLTKLARLEAIWLAQRIPRQETSS